MIYTNQGRRKEDKEPLNISLAFDNEKLKAALADSEAEVARLKLIITDLHYVLDIYSDGRGVNSYTDQLLKLARKEFN